MLVMICRCGHAILIFRKGKFISISSHCPECGYFNAWDSSNTLRPTNEFYQSEVNLANCNLYTANGRQEDCQRRLIPSVIDSSAVSGDDTGDIQSKAQLQRIEVHPSDSPNLAVRLIPKHVLKPPQPSQASLATSDESYRSCNARSVAPEQL